MRNDTHTLTALRNLEAVIGSVIRQAANPAVPVIRVSRMEAILASVFEHGLAATEHVVRSGRAFQLAA